MGEQMIRIHASLVVERATGSMMKRRNNFQPGNSAYDPVAFNQQQFNWYKRLCAIRNDNPVLSTGDFSFINAEGEMFAYKRFDMKNEIIVLFNLDKNKSQQFDLMRSQHILTC